MIILDTDHISILKYPDNERGVQLGVKLRNQPHEEVVAVSIVSVEEQMRGWLAAIAKERQAKRQVLGYRELGRLFEFFGAFNIVPFDEKAADQFDTLRGA